jgi:transposase-like protein
MVSDHEMEHPPRWAAIVSIAAKIGCTAQRLDEWAKKTEVDSGRKLGLTTDMTAKLKALERENRELRQANEILRKASAYCPGGARPPVQVISPSLMIIVEFMGRADLQGLADRPCDLSRPCRQTG